MKNLSIKFIYHKFYTYIFFIYKKFYIFDDNNETNSNLLLAMVNPITTHFQNCVKYLKQCGQCTSYKKVAERLNMHPQCLSDILHSKREVTLKILNDAITEFNCNPIYLHHGTGNMFTGVEECHSEVKENFGSITYVSEAAQAGYVEQFNNPTFEESLPSFSFPDRQYSGGIYRCFDVAGDSMEPTLFENDKMICRVIEPSLWLNNIRPNFVYVFATKTGIVVKRVISISKENQSVSLSSDNEFYKPFELKLSDIIEVSTLISCLSHFRPFQNIERKQAKEERNLLKETIAQQSQLIQQLNSRSNSTTPEMKPISEHA